MKLKNKRVLVTGGAGFIGSHLVDRIIAENPASVVIVDNFFLGREENLAAAEKQREDLKIYRLDASDLAAMQHVAQREQTEVVFNLAVVPLPTSLQYPAWTISTNIGIATVFCELARTGLIKTLFHCSSSEAYGSAIHIPMDEDHPLIPLTPYAASKAGADGIMLSYYLTYQIDVVVVRPFNNFGPRQNPGTYAGIIPIVIDRIKKGQPIEIFGDGEQTRDFIFVRDTTDAFVRTYENEITRGKVINIATGQETSINDLVGKLKKVMKVPNHLVKHIAPRSGDVRRHCGDISLAKKLIGLEMRQISNESLAETVEWYLRQS